MNIAKDNKAEREGNFNKANMKYKIHYRVLEQYDYVIEKIQESGDCSQVITDQGIKTLVKRNVSVGRLEGVFQAIEYLREKGFENTAKFIKTRNRKPYVIKSDGIYYLTDWFGENEVDFKDIKQLRILAEQLAELHNSSQGFINSSMGRIINCKLEKWVEIHQQRCIDLLNFKNLVEKKINKQDFDYLFLEAVQYYYDQGQQALEFLVISDYLKKLESCKSQGGFTYNNYNKNSLRITNDGNIYFIDFLKISREFLIFDIGRLLRKIMPLHKWKVKVAQEVILNYHKNRAISESDKQLLIAYLYFPYNFLVYTNDHYHKQSNKFSQDNTVILRKIIREDQKRERFLIEFTKFLEKL